MQAASASSTLGAKPPLSSQPHLCTTPVLHHSIKAHGPQLCAVAHCYQWARAPCAAQLQRCKCHDAWRALAGCHQLAYEILYGAALLVQSQPAKDMYFQVFCTLNRNGSRGLLMGFMQSAKSTGCSAFGCRPSLHVA